MICLVDHLFVFLTFFAFSYSITRLPNYQIHLPAHFPVSTGGSILHGDGVHFAPSFSNLKCVLVMNGNCRYLGSSTTVRTSRMTSPFGSGPTLSKYSVMVAFALYGTPFFLRYPSRKFVVATKSEPPRDGATRAGSRGPRPAPAGDGPFGVLLRSTVPCGPANCHWAAEYPCHVGGAILSGLGPKRSSRVCVPASNSTLSAVSSCQEMCMRPGIRMMLPMPYGLHARPAASSFARFQESATRRPSSFSG